jgi:tricorn protease
LKEPARQGYCRFPTIHGDQIIFCSEDDLWTVSAEGGTARRLTAGKGVSSLPRFSPDGKLVAYVCTEEGNPEIYVMPSDGGTARRLTHLGGSSLTLSGWSPDGKQILLSTNVQSSFGKATQLLSVPVAGGMAKSLKLGDSMTISIANSGAVAIGRNNLDPARWKRYHGGTAGELWVGNSLNGDFKPLITLKGNLVWPQWIGDRVFFLSDHEGIGNIYSCKSDGSDLKRHTNELEYYVRFPSTDGKRIVYTAGARIAVLDPESGTNRIIDVVAPSNLTQAKRKFVEAREYLQEFTPHPKGQSPSLVAL